MKNPVTQKYLYVVFDYLAAVVAWALFYYFRKISIESSNLGYLVDLSPDKNFVLGLVFIPGYWMVLHYLSGAYNDVFHRSRLQEFFQTLFITAFGVIALFFAIILDDFVVGYQDYYTLFFVLTSLQFIITCIPRLIITSHTIHKIRNRKIGFNTIIVGSYKQALNLYNELAEQPRSDGSRFVGFVNVEGNRDSLLKPYLKYLGGVDKLKEVVIDEAIEDVIIAVETSEHDKIKRILNILKPLNVRIKAIPSTYDIMVGYADISALYSAPLINISKDLMPVWETNVKRLMDISASFVSLVLLLPVYTFLAIGVKMSSKGPIMYSHKRVGMFGVPFTIYKFRSMLQNAEENGPALSSDSDLRVTKFGRYMRKLRLDELPQFYNVLIGEMSLVGPRPERQYYIDKISEKAPHYLQLHRVRPGLTSWGQVKFGYAENVDEMVERLKYDMIYIENMSIYVDLKILIYTIKVLAQAEGK